MNTALRWMVIVGCVWCAAAPSSWSDETSTSVATAPEDRTDEAMGRYNLHPVLTKLGRGVSNLAGGWLEIPVNMHQHYTEHDTVGSLLTGAAYGIVKGLVRTSVGAYETVTFFLPYPENYAPILPTLEYYDNAKRSRLPNEF